MYGRENELEEVIELLSFTEPPDEPLVIAITGESGSGKTLFSRCVIEGLRTEERNPDFPKWKFGEKVHLLASSISAESEKLFLNSWVPILR